MAVILLVRHGQASWGADDYDRLSETGAQQSRHLGTVLRDRGIRPTHLIRGSMRRHRETADQLAAGAGWDESVAVDPGWDEFDHVQMLEVRGPPNGSGDRVTRQELDAWFDAAVERWVGGAFDDEYDEPFHRFTERVESAFRRTAADLGGGDVAVVVTSGGPISWVVTTLLGGGVDLWTRVNPVLVNAGLTKIVVGGRGTTLVSVNEHGHLEPDLTTYR